MKRIKTDYYEGVEIRRLPPGPEEMAASRPRSPITATPQAVFDTALDTVISRLGSDSHFDERQNMGPDDFPESDIELEPAGSTQVTTNSDGEYISYLASR
jgi:hypothetical protein